MNKLIMILVVAAVPATAMAATWSGLGGDWKGFTNVWDASSNWEGTENEWLTDRWSIDPADVAMYGGTSMPTITDGMDTIGGWVRIRNNAVITQTGGSHQFANGTGSANSFYIYGGGQWNISGGSLTVNGTMQLGYNQGSANSNGTEAINISGDGVVNLLEMTWGPGYPYNLMINAAAPGITIADQGQFVVSTALMTTVDAFISSGKIVGVGGALQTIETGNLYVVSLVPEPATLALLGLGGLGLIRRRRA